MGKVKTSCLLKISLVINLFITPLMFSGYARAETEYKVVVDGKSVVFQNKPFVINGRIWVPFRETMETMGGKVEWLPDRQLFYAVFGQSRSLGYSLIDEVGLINGMPFESHFLPIVKNERSYVPVRNITEMLDLQTKWNQAESTVSIETKNLQLLVAVESGDANLVIHLLKNGTDPNSSIHDQTAIRSATNTRNIYIAQLLLEKGANTNSGYITPLSDATEDGDIKMTKLLLEHGADSNKSIFETPLMLAARENYTGVVKELLKAGADPNLQNHKWDSLPLSHAVSDGNVEMVKDLLRANADPNKKLWESYKSHSYAIIEAAAKNNVELIKILLQAGANPNVSDYYDWTPLKVAAELGNTEAIDILIKGGADPNKHDSFSPSALDIAIGLGNTEASKMLKDNGAVTTEKEYYKLTRGNSTYDSSWSPLMIAAHEGNTKKVNQLLASGAYVNQVSENHQDTTLNLALEKGNIETIRSLLDAGADPNLGKHDFYLWNISPKILNLIIRKGFDINRIPPDGVPLLHWIVRHNQIDMLLAALQHGASPNINDNVVGDTPLAIAVEYGNREAMDILLRYGATVNPTDAVNPLIKSIHFGDSEIMTKLLFLGANPNSKFKNNSALTYATYYGDTQTVKLLLSHGANPNEKMNDETLLQYVDKKGYTKIAELLREAGAIQ